MLFRECAETVMEQRPRRHRSYHLYDELERDVSGIMLRQAQAEAAMQRQAELPAFALDLPDSVQHRTVYTFHLAGGS